MYNTGECSSYLTQQLCVLIWHESPNRVNDRCSVNILQQKGCGPRFASRSPFYKHVAQIVGVFAIFQGRSVDTMTRFKCD